MSSINDKSDWKTVRKALSVIEFSESDIEVRLYSTLTGFYLVLKFWFSNISPLVFSLYTSLALVWNHC